MRFSLFFTFIATSVLLGHLYLYHRLVPRLTDDRRWRYGLGALLMVVTVAILLRGPIRDLGEQAERWHALFAYSYMALGISFVLALLATDVGGLALRIVRRLRPRAAVGRAVPEPTTPTRGASASVLAAGAPATRAPSSEPVDEAPDPARRVFLERVAGWSTVAGGAAIATYGTWRAMVPPEVTEVVVPVTKLPAALDGLRIVQLTDVHVGPFIKREFLDALVSATNARRPDLVVITGDLVDGGVRELGASVAALGNLRSRYGTFFVTGNHEYYSGVEPWVAYLQRIGVDVLRNRRVEIGDAGGSIDLVGVDDWTGARRRGGQGYDLEAAIAGRDPERAAVLLAHQPMNFERAAERSIDLQLSGHTHGGQFFPMTALVGLRYEFTRGLYRRRDSHIFVSRGCGFWGPPHRTASAPELVEITLTRA